MSNKSEGQRRAWLKRREASLREYITAPVVIDADGCWIWKGKTDNSYGLACWMGEERSAHIVSYEEYHGLVPEGLCVLHHCDKRPCVNPNCLYVGNKKQNRRDFMERHPRAQELTAALIKKGAEGVQRFWDKLSSEERSEFVRKRAEIQKEKRRASLNS